MLPVTERLLQFIWQFQYFNRSELTTCTGESLLIFFQGHYNKNQGPDFTTARIRLKETTWAGSIELHIKTSDWMRHRHESDTNYQNVILHVVWEHDQPVNNIPVLELKHRVSGLLLRRYESLMEASSFIPCDKSIHTIPTLHFASWKERLLAERMLRKNNIITEYLKQNKYHWEEMFWSLIARSFGMKVNADAFEAIARSVPLTLLAKQKYQLHHVEALLFGQAGLLEKDFTEAYPQLLKREYRFLQRKYELRPIYAPLLFLRMRPGNFPTVRLAQLAMLIYESVHLFSRIRDADTIQEVKAMLHITANDYWHYHYRFDELSVFKKKTIGSTMMCNIIINTIVPVLFAYGHYHGENAYKQKALQWLEAVDPELNTVTKGFLNLEVTCQSAYDSQALLELKSNYCDHKKCLDCAIGNLLLKAKNIKED